MRRARRTIGVREAVKTLLLLAAVVWLAALVLGIWRKEEIARQAVADTRTELAALEERKAALAAQVAELETERGQEATIRQNLRVARPGEEVIIVVPEQETPPPPPPTFWERVRAWLPW